MTKILIVDDIPQNLYMLEVLLKTNGYEVAQASNGIDALDLAHKDPPALVISDILMPGMDGFSLCRAWKSDEKLKGIPFIFYTATYIDSRDEKLALNLGAERFLVKPMDPEKFLSILRETMQKEPVDAIVADQPALENEEVFFKEYNDVLVHKLEHKMLELQKSNMRLASLYEASCDMLSIKSPLELIHITLNAIVKIAGYQQANFFFYDENQQKLRLEDLEGYSENSIPDLKEKLVFDYGEPKGIAGMVAKTRQTVNLTDTATDPNWISIDPLIKSALFTPMVYEKKLLGVIGLFSKETNAFDADDEHDIIVLANNLAIAIENARNQQKIQKQLAQISALHNIDMAINSSLDIRNTLNIFLKHVTTQLKMDSADVLLCQHNETYCEFAAGRGFRTQLPENLSVRMEKNLAKKAAQERRIIHTTEINEGMVTPEFQKFWKNEGFATYVSAPLIAGGNVIGVLEVYHRTKFNPDPEWLEYFETLAGQASIAIDKGTIFNGLQRSNLELNMAYDATIKGWSRALDMRDQETEGHTQRVTEMTLRLAEMKGITGDELIQIRRGSLLHDIGKLGVSDSILLKPGELTTAEETIMRRHPQSAYDLLYPIDYLHTALEIPYCHHEKWDGTGYPRKLKGELIPLSARIFAIVDVYDALRSDRPYRKAWDEEKVISYIRDQAGVSFDPEITQLFLKMVSQNNRP